MAHDSTIRIQFCITILLNMNRLFVPQLFGNKVNIRYSPNTKTFTNHLHFLQPGHNHHHIKTQFLSQARCPSCLSATSFKALNARLNIKYANNIN